MVTIIHRHERARIYAEGGIGFEYHQKGIGWVIDDDPSEVIQRLAEGMHRLIHGSTSADPIDPRGQEATPPR